MVHRQPDDQFLLSQISPVVIDVQKASRRSAAARQSRVSEAIREGEVIEERSIAVLVDYPIEKERITTLIERIFYEREYVRQTKLIKEVQLESYTEELSRKTVPKNSNGSIPHSSSRAGEPVHSEKEEKTTPFAQNGALSRVSEEATQLIKVGEPRQMPSTSQSQAPAPAANPFKDFVQPRQQDPPKSAPQQALPAPQEQETALGKGQQAGKSKKKFGLKWFFAAPFKTGKEPKPDMEEVSDSQPLDTTSDTPSSRDLHVEPRDEFRPQQSSQPPLALSNTPHTPAAVPEPLQASPSENAVVKKPGFSHEAAVRRALQEGAADESQREVFTQIEEERNTIERVERFVDHQYFLREYVVRVVYVGERLLGQSIEPLQSGQYLMAGSSLGQQIPVTHPATLA